MSLAPRHALPSPGTLSAGSVPGSPLSTMTPSPGGVSLRERTPPVTQPSPVVSSPLLAPSGLPDTQRQTVIRQADFMSEMPSTPRSYQSSGFAYGPSPSEMPSLSAVRRLLYLVCMKSVACVFVGIACFSGTCCWWISSVWCCRYSGTYVWL